MRVKAKMANLGLLGAVSVGKTTILRLFVKYLNTKKISEIEDGKECEVVKTDFSGEAVLDPETGVKETKTIHPNRVVFRDLSANRNHTVFAPGGDRGRAVVRMGVITISRIAKQIIAVFDCSRPLKEQFEFFRDVRFFPREIYVCLNKVDLIDKAERDKQIKLMNSSIIEHFGKRKINPKQFFIVCAEDLDGMKTYNDEIPKMILKIATASK